MLSRTFEPPDLRAHRYSAYPQVTIQRWLVREIKHWRYMQLEAARREEEGSTESKQNIPKKRSSGFLGRLSPVSYESDMLEYHVSMFH